MDKKDTKSKALIHVPTRHPPQRMEYTILVIGGEEEDRKSIVRVLERSGYNVLSANKGRDAFKTLKAKAVDLVICDMELSDRSGMDILKFIGRSYPETSVIMVTTKGSVNEAVDAMKEGAVDYISKPVDLKDFFARVEKAISNRRLSREVDLLRKEISERHSRYRIIGKSKPIKDIFSKIALVAPTKTNIMITGESGTGKELIARAIHFASPRKNKPFIALNCSAFTETLLESELFGYERGAFTGAYERRLGKFELAQGGTIFLDEVGETSLKTQVKLLRVLEEKEVMRIGGSGIITVDVRLIAATNRNLEQAIKERAFREDFYYRLNVITIDIPPLRERKEDIPLLIDGFIKDFSRENHKTIKGVDKKTLNILLNYHWPGNVRELRNVIEYMVVLSKKEILSYDDLPSSIKAPFKTAAPLLKIEEGMTMAQIEREAIKNTLMAVGGNRAKAARILNIGLRTIQRKIKEYELG